MSAPKMLDLDALHVLPDGRVSPSLHMTEPEFLAWCDEDTRAEWVDGEVLLTPAESLLHSDLNVWLAMLVRLFVSRRNLGGRVVGPNVLVRLSAQRRLRVPDLLYVSAERLPLVQPTLVDGAPDLAVEIVSPDSQSRDRRAKFLEYERAGVREYWIIDPLSQTVEAYAQSATAGGFTLVLPQDGVIVSTVLPGFHLRPEWLWQQPLLDLLDVLKQMGVQP